MNKIIVIPDVHGRKFWRQALSFVEESHIVFLGDFLDPYYGENIDPDDAYDELDEILSWKIQHPQKISLLMGNHDLHYLSSNGGCRYDYHNAYRNKSFFWSNLQYFDLAYAVECSDNQYLFTHAGVLRRWYEKHFRSDDIVGAKEIAERLNGLFHGGPSRSALMEALSESSFLRGGQDDCGSSVWADLDEQRLDWFEFDGIYQVFGHTLRSKPLITPFWACLDCRKAFIVDLGTGKISELE